MALSGDNIQIFAALFIILVLFAMKFAMQKFIDITRIDKASQYGRKKKEWKYTKQDISLHISINGVF